MSAQCHFVHGAANVAVSQVIGREIPYGPTLTSTVSNICKLEPKCRISLNPAQAISFVSNL